MNIRFDLKNKSTLSTQDIRILERYSKKNLPDRIENISSRVVASFWNEYELMPDPAKGISENKL